VTDIKIFSRTTQELERQAKMTAIYLCVSFQDLYKHCKTAESDGPQEQKSNERINCVDTGS